MTITWLANYSSITNCQIMSWFCLAMFVSEAKYKIARIGKKLQIYQKYSPSVKL